MIEFINGLETTAQNTTNTSTLGIVIIFLIAAVVVYAYFGICTSRILKKTGFNDSWQGWVPILGQWRLNEAVGKPGWWALLALGSSIPFLGIFISITATVLSIIVLNKLGKSFGKSFGFIVGLVLLPLPFLGILAFDNSIFNKTFTEL